MGKKKKQRPDYVLTPEQIALYTQPDVPHPRLDGTPDPLEEKFQKRESHLKAMRTFQAEHCKECGHARHTDKGVGCVAVDCDCHAHKHDWKIKPANPLWVWFECAVCRRWRMLWKEELKTLVVDGQRLPTVEQFFTADH